jgi:hypothetical protein
MAEGFIGAPFAMVRQAKPSPWPYQLAGPQDAAAEAGRAAMGARKAVAARTLSRIEDSMRKVK